MSGAFPLNVTEANLASVLTENRAVLPAVGVLCMEIILRRCLCPPCSQSPVKASAGVSLLLKLFMQVARFAVLL